MVVRAHDHVCFFARLDHCQRILKPEDVAGAVLYVAAQPPHVSIPELIIKPTSQAYV